MDFSVNTSAALALIWFGNHKSAFKILIGNISFLSIVLGLEENTLTHHNNSRIASFYILYELLDRFDFARNI